MPAVPLIISGVGAAASAWQAHKMGQMVDTQRGMAGEQSALAREISGFARENHSMAQPALQKAMQYYMNLASGNRAAINSALAPDRAALADAYKGAQRGLENTTARGPGRDRQIAEMYRQKAGQLGLMPFMAKSGAMQNLQGLGQNLMSGMQGMYGTAASALTGASNTMNNASYGMDRQFGYMNNFLNMAGRAGQEGYEWWKRSHPGTNNG